jgi:hypothetical protein
MATRFDQTDEGRTRFQQHVLSVQMTYRRLAAAQAKIDGRPYLPTPPVR